MEIIAFAHNGYTDKFGIPRQSGRVEAVETRIVFTAPFRSPDAIRGIEQWSHLWLIWSPTGRDERIASSPEPTSKYSRVETPYIASPSEHEQSSPPAGGVRGGLTVRPPRLGGNTRLGVFATRSPFRPNGLCLSSVKLLRVEQTENEGNVLIVSGADLMNGTPIYDIKPYLPYTDSHPEATNGFAEDHRNDALQVRWSPEAEQMLNALLVETPYIASPSEHGQSSPQGGIRGGLNAILAEDPRPAYHNDPNRIYGLTFAGFNLHFRVEGNLLTVLDIALTT